MFLSSKTCVALVRAFPLTLLPMLALADSPDALHEEGRASGEMYQCAYRLEEFRHLHRTGQGHSRSASAVIARAAFQQADRQLRRERRLRDTGWVPTKAALLAEIERMKRQTRMPERLQDLFAVFDHDQDAIARCLARPVLTDRAHGQLEREARLPEGWADEAAGGSWRSHLSTTVDSDAGGGGHDAWRVESFPEYRFGHVRVWTGSEMIVWGGNANGSLLDTGGRYDPVTDSWRGISTRGAPSARSSAAAVWTGRHLVVWGGRISGSGRSASGARYDPLADVWLPMSSDGAPSARDAMSTAWTGSEMIVWGGRNATMNYADGARYNPASDTWTPISQLDAPSARVGEQSVWTGGEMIVWGGSAGGQRLDDGARYNPVSDSWMAISATGAPAARDGHSAVWTGSHMIVFGGRDDDHNRLASGGMYEPTTDRWTATATEGLAEPRVDHQAVWTGSEMLVWGGNWANLPSTGERFDPAVNAWTPMSSAGAPPGRLGHSMLWTGDRLLVWGGTNGSSRPVESGARYDPSLDQWQPMADSGAPPATSHHVSVWSGSEMLVWGGNGSQGWRYDPVLDAWTPMSVDKAPAGRIRATGVWSGSELIVWGGISSSQPRNTGGRYNPLTDTWQATALVDAPQPRQHHSAVWTGTEMIVWGGAGDAVLSDGGRYDPESDSWSTMDTAGAPEARREHSAVWTGSEMIVWGGRTSLSNRLGSGGRYDPAADDWLPVSDIDAPAPRYGHSVVWTGERMVVWSGNGGGNSGGRYDPGTDHWLPTRTDGAPGGRNGSQSTAWTGSEMVVWSGSGVLATSAGGRYDPVADSWRALALRGVPSARNGHKAVWTGSEMLVWGGANRALGSYRPNAAPPDPRLDITQAAAAPSLVGETVTITAEIDAGGGSVPMDGSLTVMADSGESCTDPGPPASVGPVARFVCQISFQSPGERALTAWFTGSSAFPDMDSTGRIFSHRVIEDVARSIGGQTAGLSGTGLVLENNLDDALPVDNEGVFQFEQGLLAGQTFSVRVSAQPHSPRQTCSIDPHAGVVAGEDVSDLLVSCETHHYPIGGTVTGLSAPGLVLELNNSDPLAIDEDGIFVFPDPIPDASAWVVTVAAQPGPPAQTCTVSNGQGVLDGAAVTDVQVECETNLYRVGGTVGGLAGQGLVLRNNGGDDRAIDGNGSFHFATRYPEGTPYDVTVHVEPVEPAQTCTADSASGVIGAGHVDDVEILCTSDEYIVSPLAGPGGTIVPDEVRFVSPGGIVEFELAPDSGHGIEAVGGSCPGKLTGNQYLAGPVEHDCTVEVEFSLRADELFSDRFESD